MVGVACPTCPLPAIDDQLLQVFAEVVQLVLSPVSRIAAVSNEFVKVPNGKSHLHSLS